MSWHRCPSRLLHRLLQHLQQRGTVQLSLLPRAANRFIHRCLLPPLAWRLVSPGSHTSRLGSQLPAQLTQQQLLEMTESARGKRSVQWITAMATKGQRLLQLWPHR